MNSLSSIAAIIPAYNAEKYLGEAIGSALDQTRKAHEVIVVDDASSEATGRIAAAYGRQVRLLVNEKNLGQGASRNRAINASSSDYIALLDADDKWMPSHLERVAGLLDRFPDAGVSFSRLQNFGLKNEVWPPKDCLDCWEAPADILIPLMRAQYFMPSGAVYRRSLHHDLGGFDETRPFGSEDSDFFCRAAMKVKMIGSLEPSVFYRWHEGQGLKRDWVPHYIKYFEYREKQFAIMRNHRELAARLPAATEKTVLLWEQCLDQAWRERRLSGLRSMVAFGLQCQFLTEATRSYVLRSKMPLWLVRTIDCIRARPATMCCM